jgi:hypothetical protein
LEIEISTASVNNMNAHLLLAVALEDLNLARPRARRLIIGLDLELRAGIKELEFHHLVRLYGLPVKSMPQCPVDSASKLLLDSLNRLLLGCCV